MAQKSGSHRLSAVSVLLIERYRQLPSVLATDYRIKATQ